MCLQHLARQSVLHMAAGFQKQQKKMYMMSALLKPLLASSLLMSHQPNKLHGQAQIQGVGKQSSLCDQRSCEIFVVIFHLTTAWDQISSDKESIPEQIFQRSLSLSMERMHGKKIEYFNLVHFSSSLLPSALWDIYGLWIICACEGSSL